MRKDLRVGLGIGGVLLAVLLVAMVVKSRTRQHNQQAINKITPDKPEGGDTSGSSVDGGTGSGSGSTLDTHDPLATSPPAPPVPQTVTPPEPTKPNPPDPFDNWADMLNNGRMAAATTVTPTPGRGGERFSPSAEQPGPTGAHSGPLTPGSLPHGGVETGATGTPPPSHPAPLHTPHAAAPRTHTIAQGETYSTIARTFYGNKKYYLLIEKANPGLDPTRLRPGQTIKLPDLPAADRADRHAGHGLASGTSGDAAPTPIDSRREYVVKSGDSLYRISTRLYGTANKVDAIYDMNKDRIGPDRERLKLGMTLKLPGPPTVASR